MFAGLPIFGGVPLLRVGAGSRPGGRGTFLCFAKEKYPKERRPCCLRPSASLRATWGARARGAPWNSLRAGALRSDNHGESDDEAGVSCGTPATPRPARPRRIQKGLGANSHTGHRCARPRLRSAWRLRPRDGAERSKGPCGCWAVRLSGGSPHLAAPAAVRLRGEHARRSAHASSSDSPWLSERSAPARSEFHGAPRNRTAAGLPRRGRRLWVAFSLLTFFWRSKRK